MSKATGDSAYEQMLKGVTKNPPRPSPPPVEAETPDAEQWGDCVSLARVKGLYGLGIKRPGKLDRIIEYHDVEGEGDNSHLKVIMGARKTWLIEITGSRLLRLLYCIKEHKIEHISQANRDIDPEDGKPFISVIAITDVTPKQ